MTDTKPVRGEPGINYDYDENGFIPCTPTVGWDIEFGCRINFGWDVDGELRTFISLRRRPAQRLRSWLGHA